MFTYYLTYLPGVLIIAFITFALIVMLRSWVMILVQVLLLAIYNFVSNDTVLLIASGLQIIITVLVLYKVFQATRYNYELVEEKTHAIDRKLTKYEFSGVRSSFWKSN